MNNTPAHLESVKQGPDGRDVIDQEAFAGRLVSAAAALGTVETVDPAALNATVEQAVAVDTPAEQAAGDAAADQAEGDEAPGQTDQGSHETAVPEPPSPYAQKLLANLGALAWEGDGSGGVTLPSDEQIAAAMADPLHRTDPRVLPVELY